MSKRSIFLAVIIVIIIILGLAGYYFYVMYLPNQNTVNSNLTNQVIAENINAVNGQNTNTAIIQPLTPPQDDQGKLQLLAAVFTATYGSYSNQTSLTNFDDLYGYMVQTMKNWVESTYKAQIMTQHPKNVYYAIETKVLNVQINDLDENKGTAEILVNTQRQEFNESPDNVTVIEQNLLLNMIKVNDKWIVGSAYWK
jgi:anionic cell wall polymer biosynthesis LytR-Cps2A-Psr (LCP) family protein